MQQTRRDFLKTSGAVTAGMAWAGSTGVSQAAETSVQRPNILLFHSHDLGQFLHCYGIKTVQTPNLDAFAAAGVRFARSFCTAPQCSPSRASIFTGRYPHNNGVMGLCHANFAWDLHPEERHMAQVLKDAGYATWAVGVVHETKSGHQRCGYDGYDSDALATTATDNAIRRLKELQAQSKPFFLCIGTIEPHRLRNPDPPHENYFLGGHLQPDDALGVAIPGYLKDTPGTRREVAELQGAIRHVDENFGRLMQALKDLKLEENTLVIFTTDHGVALPRAKASLYDPGVQVALLLRYPRRPGWHGGVVPQPLVYNMDLLPSIMELIGVERPANLHGKSFLPLLEGGAYEPRKELFFEITYHDYYDPRRSIRTETHKLIANFTAAPAFMDPSQCWRPRSDTVVPENHATAFHPYLELYDLVADPHEQVDLAGKPKYAQIRKELACRLLQHLTQTDDPILQGAVTSPQHKKAVELLKGA